MREKTIRLMECSRRRTRYEVVMSRDGAEYRVGYTGRHSKTGMGELLSHQGVDLACRLEDGGAAEYRYGSGLTAQLCGWDVRFARTEREAITDGELPSYRALPVLCDVEVAPREEAR